jgi:hypothetical protein
MALLLAKTVFLSLGLNYGVHYTSARLFDTYCVPHSLREVLQSFITTASPVCSFLLNTMTATQSNYAAAISGSCVSALSSALKLFS